MNSSLHTNVKLFSLLILILIFNIGNIKSQINCESFKQVKTSDKITSSYTNWTGKKADPWTNSFVDIFVNGSNEVFLVSLRPENLYIEKYDAQLNLLQTESFDIVINKSRTYYGVTQVGDQFYIIYTEKIKNGSLVKSTKLYAQKIDNNTLKLNEEKIDMLGVDEDFDIDRSATGDVFEPKAKVYMALSENHKYLSLVVYPQSKDLNALANFNYKVFSDDLSIVYEGVISTESKLTNIQSLETGISDNGDFALGIGVAKKLKTGKENYIAQVIYFTQKTNKVYTTELEDASGYARSLKFLFLDKKLCVDLVWQKFEEKSFFSINKVYLFDITTGNKIKDFNNMLFDYLPEAEASTYGRASKNGYDPASREFSLFAIQEDKEGSLYLSYVDYLPIITEGINVTNIQNVTLGAVAYVKLDDNYENMWAHLFYFTDWSSNKLIIDNGKVHTYGNSYEKISAAAGSDLKTIYKSQIAAANAGEKYRYEINFEENGTFKITELIGNCSIKFKNYAWLEGNYFPQLNAFYYFGRPVGKNQPGYIFKFGF